MDRVAIVGMAGKFPQADCVEEFWSNIQLGKDCITRKNSKEVLCRNTIKRVNARGCIRNVFDYDAEFFNISEKDVRLSDPQNRQFLECVWKAFESSGYDWDELPEKVSVYASSAPSTYLYQDAFNTPVERMNCYLENSQDFFASKISYKLDFKGESLNVQTACSSSLTAVYLACQSLNNYQCDMAIAGGANILLPQEKGYLFQKGLMYAEDGVCRPFDEKASGMVESNAVGVVLLKRLNEAVKDGDNILAVIRGGAMNNDGNDKLGYTAPSITGQKDVIQKAMEDANVMPTDIGYIETHGTGTILGDLIEIEALKDNFKGVKTDIYLGSVKGNIGHTIRASGISGLIKTVLVLNNHVIPPMANHIKANPDLELEKSCFKINTKPVVWNNRGHSRIAGISSFGFGGTNVHLIVEEYCNAQERRTENEPEILLISARDEAEMLAIRNSILMVLKKQPEINIHDLAYTMNIGRRQFKTRWGCFFYTYQEVYDALSGRGAIIMEIKNRSDRLYIDMLNLWLNGESIDQVRKFYLKKGGNRINLPTYPLRYLTYVHSAYQVENTDNKKSVPKINQVNNKNISITITEKEIEEVIRREFVKGSSERDFQWEIDFYEMGMDSMDYTEIILECESIFEIQIPWKEAFNNNTPRALKDLCMKLISEKNNQ